MKTFLYVSHIKIIAEWQTSQWNQVNYSHVFQTHLYKAFIFSFIFQS